MSDGSARGADGAANTDELTRLDRTDRAQTWFVSGSGGWPDGGGWSSGGQDRPPRRPPGPDTPTQDRRRTPPRQASWDDILALPDLREDPIASDELRVSSPNRDREAAESRAQPPAPSSTAIPEAALLLEARRRDGRSLALAKLVVLTLSLVILTVSLVLMITALLAPPRPVAPPPVEIEASAPPDSPV